VVSVLLAGTVANSLTTTSLGTEGDSTLLSREFLTESEYRPLGVTKVHGIPNPKRGQRKSQNNSVFLEMLWGAGLDEHCRREFEVGAQQLRLLFADLAFAGQDLRHVAFVLQDWP